MIKDINFAAINLTGFENLSGFADGVTRASGSLSYEPVVRDTGFATLTTTFQKFKTFGKFAGNCQVKTTRLVTLALT